MGTFLFDNIIFGPVRSRRLGVSLGINLLPANLKVCTFNCIYCECGWTCRKDISTIEFPSRALIRQSLQAKLIELVNAGTPPDSLTYAGNGEPLLHPEFDKIIDDTILLRNQSSPGSRIAVLSNASLINNSKIIESLKKIDLNILKLDTGIEKTFNLLNQPRIKITLDQIKNNLKQFNGQLSIQTLFIRGFYKNHRIDNTTNDELQALLSAYQEIHPGEVMVYTYDRETPVTGLEKIPYYELRTIADKIEEIGIKTQISP